MTDNAIIRKDGATAGHVQESLATISDSGEVNIPAGLTYNVGGSPHTHAGLSTYDSDVIFTDNTTNNADSDAHGYLPKLSADSTEFLSGSGEWLTPGGGGGLYVSYAKLMDSKTNGTNGGDFTSGSYATRVLNTEVVDADGIVTLASNQFTLGAGTYRFLISCPAYKTGRHKAKLYNVTDAADAIVGSAGFSAAASGYATTHSFISGQITIADTKVFEVQHRCETTSGSGFGLGVASSFGEVEVYTVVEIWKLSG